MQKRSRLWALVALLGFVLIIHTYPVAYASAEIDKNLKGEIKAAIDRGLRWLRGQQAGQCCPLQQLLFRSFLRKLGFESS